ncbi:hypothetical protein BGZ47_006039 [Haplosporangium gracile]|nr:hypothetical protein BGZ47_006039 [Haplosporangium gracile]
MEDHSGLAPCYVCGEWYAEEVYCSGDEGDSSYRKVDGRSWHERGGASLRHQVAETRVRQWLEQVVVPVASAATWPSSPYYYQQHQQQKQQPHHYYQQEQQQEEEEEEKKKQTQQQPAVIRSRPSRSASCTATFSIPEEIMDPSIRRSPGFRIKRRDSITTERPATLPSPVVEQVPATSYSAPSSASSTLTNSKSTPFRFSFTSERFNAAIQESLSRRSSTTTSSTAVVPQQSPSSNTNANTNNINSSAKGIQVEAVAEQTEAEPEMEAETKTQTEAVIVAESETASTSAQATPSLFSFISFPSFPSRGSPSSSAAGKVDQCDQYGVAKEAFVNTYSTVAQQPSSTLSSSSSASMGTSFSTFSFGKSQLDSPQAVTPSTTGTAPPPQTQQQQQQQQEAARGRVRRRGHGHVRQLAQSHILVMGSSFHHTLPQLEQNTESEIGGSSGPMVMSPPFPSSSSSSSSSSLPLRAPRSQHGLLMSPMSSSPTPPSFKKNTVSFALPLPLPRKEKQ